MSKACKKITLLIAAFASLITTPSFAQGGNSYIPYGGYRKGSKCGCYGARSSIKTVAEARRIIEEFIEGHDLHIGAMDERPRFFRAELLDNNGTVRDVVIVHKANGRIRSIY